MAWADFENALWNGRGFTLVELVFVVAIIATLASIAVPSYLGFVERARVVRARSEIRSIANIIDAHEVNEGTPPASLADAGQPVILDPWGRPYVYLRIAGSGPLVNTAPPRPRVALGAGPPRLILASGPSSPTSPSSPAPAPAPAPAPSPSPSPAAAPEPAPAPAPEPAPAPAPEPAPAPAPEPAPAPAPAPSPPSDPNLIGEARKDRFLVPLNSDYDLYSVGKDGESQPPLSARQSQDDVVRANDGAYIGLASQY